ncbi:MAG: DUF2339 domain-containing protein [Stenotrophomonas sp.]
MEALLTLLVLVSLSIPVLLITLTVMVFGLKRRVAVLESSMTMGSAAQAQEAWQPAEVATPPPLRERKPEGPDTAEHAAAFQVAPEPVVAVVEPPRTPPGVTANAAPPPLPLPLPPAAPAGPGFIERIAGTIKRWFSEGNVPVKIGMLVLLAGVAALLKYASDQGWLSAPIELRMAAIATVALAGLVFGWRKRESHRAFALALQGGAIGVLLLTVFAAFKRYDLVDAGPAFALSVVLIAGLAVMAVLQESRTLAILGVLAGFMAPIWLSDGSGNHVGLFSYYAVLNAGIFAIAWVRPWRILNLLGFVFTWGIGTAWGVLQYSPHQFNSTEPFLVLFFAFYLLLPLLYARKVATPGTARIDGCLLFGTPLIAFSLQAGLLQGDRMSLALCALGVAALYALLARALIHRDRLQVLARGYAILAVGFATLSVPLALSAKATASVFALEGAGLVWLGLIQQRRLARWSGVALQLAAAGALLIDGSRGHAVGMVGVANAAFMGALLIALAGFASAWLYRDAGQRRVATVAYVWGLAWWLGNITLEIGDFVDSGNRLHAVLLLLGVTGWLAAEVQRRAPATALSLTTLGGFVLAFPVAFLQLSEYGQPFAGNGAWTWPLFAVLGVRSLLCLRAGSGSVAGLAQLVWWLLWPTVLSLLAWYLGERFQLAEGWVGMLLALPWLLLAVMSMRRWRWLAQPLGAAFDAYQPALQAVVFAALGLWWLLSLASAGSAAPLPWIVVFNPLELAQVALLVLVAMRLWQGADERIPAARMVGVALAALVLVTVMTLRATHHWGGEPWNDALPGSRLAQTSLTVVWSLLGVVGWVSGSRRGQWGLWLAGAILMGVVLAKLLLIDRGNLGDLFGIAAFIAYGLLCTLVGWLAPAPPRRVQAAENLEETTA